MARGPATFRQSDLTRLLKAVKASGVECRRIEACKDGKIIIVPGRSEEAEPEPNMNEWDGAS